LNHGTELNAEFDTEKPPTVKSETAVKEKVSESDGGGETATKTATKGEVKTDIKSDTMATTKTAAKRTRKKSTDKKSVKKVEAERNSDSANEKYSTLRLKEGLLAQLNLVKYAKGHRNVTSVIEHLLDNYDGGDELRAMLDSIKAKQ